MFWSKCYFWYIVILIEFFMKFNISRALSKKEIFEYFENWPNYIRIKTNLALVYVLKYIVYENGKLNKTNNVYHTLIFIIRFFRFIY